MSKFGCHAGATGNTAYRQAGRLVRSAFPPSGALVSRGAEGDLAPQISFLNGDGHTIFCLIENL